MPVHAYLVTDCRWYGQERVGGDLVLERFSGRGRSQGAARRALLSGTGRAAQAAGRCERGSGLEPKIARKLPSKVSRKSRIPATSSPVIGPGARARSSDTSAASGFASGRGRAMAPSEVLTMAATR